MPARHPIFDRHLDTAPVTADLNTANRTLAFIPDGALLSADDRVAELADALDSDF